VACAEAGNFADAIRCAKKALEIGFEDAADKEKAGQHLALFQAGKPCREN